MPRPRTVYRGKRKYSWIITLAVTLLVVVILLAVWLFYHLQRYIVYDKDGLRLDLSAQREELLRPGDVFCHCYHAKGNTILDDKGHVSKEIWEAKKRGVLFDAANGKSNFAFSVAEPAMAEGFFPDIISTDLTCLTIYKDYSFGLPYVLSKYICMGMPVDQVLKAATETPAKWLGKETEIGTLAPGARADIAVFRWKEMPVTYRDARGDSYCGKGLLIPQMTVKDGVIVFRQPDFAL